MPVKNVAIAGINGLDISQVSRQVLRSFITSIPQDCLHLPGTIRQNLMPWLLIEYDSERRDVDESIVHDTLVSLGLSSQVHIAGGLDTNMAELGLSAGEEQLFSLARSILTRLHTSSQIMLMDEPTCNMDVEMDKRMQKLLKTTFAGCTVLHISHREQAVADSDAIFEIKNGVIKLKESEQPMGE